MSAFDLAIGISEGNLNTASSAVYQKLYPKVFTGSGNVTKDGTKFTVSFDVKAAPTFDLSPSNEVQAMLADSMRQQAEDTLSDEEHQFVSQVAASVPTFQAHFPQVKVEFKSPSTPDPTTFTLDLTAFCHASVQNGTVSLAPYKVTAEPQKIPLNEWFVKNFVIPQILQAAQSLLTGLKIPPLSFASVKLSDPVLGIVGNQLIAVANLASKGIPSPPNGSSWPDAGFFALVGPDVIQTAASGQHDSMSGHGDEGSDAFKAYYSYSMELENPRTSISGTNLNITVSLSGSISAGVHVLWVPIGLGYGAKAVPNPTAVCGLSVSGNQLVVTSKSVSPFTVIVYPTGSIPSKVLSWMTEFIVQGIVAALSPAISSFMGGIKFTSFDIPTYDVDVQGTHLKATPTDLSISNVSGNIALLGSLVVS